MGYHLPMFLLSSLMLAGLVALTVKRHDGSMDGSTTLF